MITAFIVTSTLGLAVGLFQGVVGWERVRLRTAFPTDLHYIKTWLRSHRCDSDTQIRTASNKSTVRQEDPVWKFFQANAHFIRTIWCSVP